MKKVRKQFVLYAMVAVFVLLTVLLVVINGTNFTMLAEDADMVTQMIAKEKGAFGEEEKKRRIPEEAGWGLGRMEGMGPNSPELPFSARYFTFRFDKEGNAEEVSFHVSAYTKEEAQAIAQSLVKEKTGWVNGIYRYRVYKNANYVYVTVVDQGREMLPAYRTLAISIIGEGVFLLICLWFLIYVSGRLFRPLEEADRKQKKFLAEAKKEFQVPLTVIGANTEILEKEKGADEYTQSIHRQVKKMISLTKQLDGFAIFREEAEGKASCDLSMIVRASAEAARSKFVEQGISLTVDAGEEILLKAEEEAMQKVVSELLENERKYAVSHASLSLRQEEGHVILQAVNDTTLSSRNAEAAFDRFTRLENAGEQEGNGLGLSYVKDIAKTHNGRVSAKVKDGEFIVKVTL